MCFIVKTYYHIPQESAITLPVLCSINAVCYLHQNDIVHIDTKSSNALVNSHYYGSLKASRLKVVFQEQSIVHKLGDLGEARSTFAQICMITRNAHTRFNTKGSAAFMASEILLHKNF